MVLGKLCLMSLLVLVWSQDQLFTAASPVEPQDSDGFLTELQAMKQTIGEQKQMMEKQKQRMKKQQQLVQALKSDLDEEKSKTSVHGKKGGALFHTSLIGFSAFAATTEIYNTYDIVQFGTTWYNSGDYSESTSVLTCREGSEGPYFVSLTILFNLQLDENFFGSVRLYRDTTILGTIQGLNQDTETATVHETASMSVIVQCSAGQRLFVEAAATLTRIAGGSGRWTTFSAFLLADSPVTAE